MLAWKVWGGLQELYLALSRGKGQANSGTRGEEAVVPQHCSVALLVQRPHSLLCFSNLLSLLCLWFVPHPASSLSSPPHSHRLRWAGRGP